MDIFIDANCTEQLSPLSKFSDLLPPQQQETLRRLSHVLAPPIDAPNLIRVLQGASYSIEAYGSTLFCPNEVFREIENGVAALLRSAIEFKEKYGAHNELERPLMRRLRRNPAWGLCMEVHQDAQNKLCVVAVGVELAVSFAINKPYPCTFANNLRGALNAQAQPTQTGVNHQSFIPVNALSRFEKTRQNGTKLFETNNPHDSDEQLASLTNSKVRDHLVRNQTYASPNHRRGVLDHQHQSALQLIQSANELRERAEAGDDTAILAILAFVSGLSAEITADIPLIQSASEDWQITIDIAAGIIKTDIAFLCPNAAAPTLESSTNYRGANKIVCKPLPTFIREILAGRLAQSKNAKCVGDLVVEAETTGRALTIVNSECGISPSVSRFIASAAPFAIQSGVNRLAAAIVTNDFSVIPSSKLYYARIEREEIWQASEVILERLGWGNPMPMEQGLATGSQVTATRTAINSLFQWMEEEVSSICPGRRYSLPSLFDHHSAYAKNCASFSVLCLSAREAKTLHFSADELNAEHTFVSLLDKGSGQFPGAMPVPINELLAEQLRLYRAHCASFDRRLMKLGIPDDSDLRRHLQKVLLEQNVPLFFRIDARGRAIGLGSNDLTGWWPPDLRLTPNFSRSFWQVELHLAGVQEPMIDLFVRHQLLGMESHTSTTHQILLEAFSRVCEVQAEVLKSMGICPIAGLAKN